jgi:hypothetical protein
VVLRIGSPAVAIGSARLLSACFGAAGVLMVAWLALILLPSRPRVVVAAAWFVALLPAVPHYSAFAYNDGLGFLASTATLVTGALALRRGPTRWRTTGLAAAAASVQPAGAPAPRAVADMLHRHGVAHPWLLLAAASLTVLVGFVLQQGGLRLLASEQPRERPALPPAKARPEPAAHPQPAAGGGGEGGGGGGGGGSSNQASPSARSVGSPPLPARGR